MRRVLHEGATRSRVDAVFFDPTGRRWRILRAAFAALLVAAVAAMTATGIAALDPPTAEPAVSPTTADDLPLEPPVIGEGPMVRLVRPRPGEQGIDLVDPHSGVRLRTASTAEAATIGDAAYVVERFDAPPPETRRLVLTFDDGPDPVYTPQILDLLAEHDARATFFVLGQHAARHPEIVRRVVREGHHLGNHTLTHADVAEVGSLRARVEVLATDRVIRAVTGTGTTLFRPPHGGEDERSDQRDALAYARAQQYGYQVASFDFDSDDWLYAVDGEPGTLQYPELDGTSRTLLLHDAGGDRSATVDYVAELLDRGEQAGYTFDTMEGALSSVERSAVPSGAGLADHAVLAAVLVAFVWPSTITGAMFLVAVFSAILMGFANLVIASGRRWRRARRPATEHGRRLPPTTALVAAYNEEAVIGQTLDALARSTVRDLEILVVDDGSADATADIVAARAADDDRIRLIRQPNAGKPAALNRGFAAARGDVVTTLDADTLFLPDTIANLARHFADDTTERLAAVAGVVKVGNRRNLVTRWQAVEYITQISVERAAQDSLRAIMIVPGACAAWRRSAVLVAGGFSHDTLAEDCDLTLALHRRGYRVTQDDDAVCYTEAPETVAALLKQRTRWVFGTVQALWKHRGLVANPRFGALGLVMLPFAVLSIVVPLAFTPLVLGLAVAATVQEGPAVVLVAAAVFSGAHFVIASVGLILAREGPSHLAVIPIYRIVAEPLRVYLLAKSVSTAVRGARLGWNKLPRTASVAPVRLAPPQPIRRTAPPPIPAISPAAPPRALDPLTVPVDIHVRGGRR